MNGKLKIYNDKTLVNTIEFKSDKEVKDQLVSILLSEKRRGVKTTYKPIPYSDDMKIIQTFDKDRYHLPSTTKYVYYFKNLDF